MADHIDHVVKIAGIDHVAFGSDYDGVDNRLPIGLEDVSTFPNLIYVLLKRGYTEEDIEKICYKNVWRVWNAVEKVAGRIKIFVPQIFLIRLEELGLSSIFQPDFLCAKPIL